MNYKNVTVRKKLMFQKELMQIKQVHQKNVSFVTNGFLKMFDLNLKKMFVIYVLLTMAYSLKNIAILSTKGATFRCLLMGISKNEVIKKLNNSVTYDRAVF